MCITGCFSIVLCCAHTSHPGKDHLAVTTDRSCRLRDAELHMAPWHQTASNGHHGRHGPELSGFILWKSWKSTDQSSDLGSWLYGPHAKNKQSVNQDAKIYTNHLSPSIIVKQPSEHQAFAWRLLWRSP